MNENQKNTYDEISYNIKTKISNGYVFYLASYFHTLSKNKDQPFMVSELKKEFLNFSSK